MSIQPFTTISLPYEPRPWQARIHQTCAHRQVLAVHRRAGKTAVATAMLADAMLRAVPISPIDPPLFGYLAPFLNQARHIAWERLKRLVDPLVGRRLIEVREAELTLRLTGTGARIRVLGGDNADAIRGVGLDGLVLDEVGQLDEDLYDSVLLPALSDRDAWLLAIGTPSGTNLFSRLYFEATARPRWGAARLTVHDTGVFSAEQIADLQASMSQTAFAREFLCDFSASADDQVLSLADVMAAQSRVVDSTQAGHALVFGVDVARSAVGDRSCIVMRRGPRIEQVLTWRGIDNMALATRIAQEIVDRSPAAVFIDQGGGGGVIDRVRQLGHQVVEVPFGGSASDPTKWANRRAEMWWRMAEWVRTYGQLPTEQRAPGLAAELAAPTFWHDAKDRWCLEPKDQIKERIGASPDIADALALTFAAPVSGMVQSPFTSPQVRATQARREHNPFRTRR